MRVARCDAAFAMLILASMTSVGSCVARGEPAATEPFCQGGSKPNPDVILCEGFEDNGVGNRWDIGGHHGAWPESQFVQCTDGRFGFNDACAAWSNRLVFDHEWGFYGYDARRAFPAQPAFYVRWYQHISNPFDWGTLEDKSVMLHDRSDSITAYVGTSRNHLPTVRDSGPGMPFVANYQDVDTSDTGGRYTKVNRFQNQRNDITLKPGTWYLFEWYIKLNAPGTSNGVTKLWIDEASGPISTQTLRMQHDDMRWLRYHDIDKEFTVLRLLLYHQRCDGVPNTCPPRGPVILNQSQRWDDIVVSRSPIGPIAVSPPSAPHSSSY